MIELGVVDNQSAVLCYVNDKMDPVDKQDATMIVASLRDGRKIFLNIDVGQKLGFNPFHDEHGRFAAGDAKAFVDSGKKAIASVLHKLDDHKREVIAGAIVFGLYHIVGADFPPDVEEQLREKIINFADDAKVSYSIAKDYVSKAVGALIDYRTSGGGKKLTVERDTILEALINLKSAIDKMDDGGGIGKLGFDPYHDEKGRFATGDANRAFQGKQIETKTKLSKLETGALGEQIVQDYMRSVGVDDIHSLNIKGNNFPIDLAGDHQVLEVKTGLVSNGPGAQQWRATIGQPGAEERAWLAKASPDEKAAWNEEKSQAIIDRKNAALKELSKESGMKLSAKTVGVIINPDKHTADIFIFNGFHHRIGWRSPKAKNGYVKTVKYGGG